MPGTKYLTCVISSTSTSNLSVGEKVCIIGRYDGANVSIWWNGVKEDEDAQTGNVMGDYDFKLGHTWSGTEYADIKTDYLSIYNRALSASEIALLNPEPFCGFRWTSIEQLAAYIAAAPPEIKALFTDLSTQLWTIKHSQGIFTKL